MYRARDPRLRREVALKILRDAGAGAPDRQRRFATEAIAASALNHPSIVAVYDVGVEADVPYLVSELIDGVTLRQGADRGRFTLKRFLDVATGIADGLAAAHTAGIVHRDLKPENVMVTRDGRVKILDFGIAKSGDAADSPVDASALTQTATGLLLGTVPYMSPEQAAGGTVDFRSDQFSFGLVLYELATGVHPFLRGTPVQTLSAVIGDEALPLAEAVPSMPAPLRWVIERCLAKDPRARYASTSDLAADLRQLRERLSDLSNSPAPDGGAERRLRRWLTVTGVASAIAAVAFLVGAAVMPQSQQIDSYKYTPVATDAGFQGAPAWSPDGKTLAYVADVDGVLQVFTRVVQSPLRTQITHARFDCHDPFWSPDGARLYFHSQAGASDALWTVSPAGGPADVVVEGAMHAAISRDGRTLALLREEGAGIGMSLWFASSSGSQLRPYKHPPLNVPLSNGALRYSPDGSKLLIWFMGGKRTPDWPDSSGFVVIPSDDSPPRDVLPQLRGPRTPPLFTWLADSRSIVLVRDDGQTPGAHLWIADTDTNRVRPLTMTNGNEGSPAVSPDGRRLAFASEATDFDLAVAPIDGSPLRTFLSSTRNELDPAWSPTGAQYAFVSDRSGSQELWIRSEEGASERGAFERPLVTDADFDGVHTMVLGSLAFSPDGQRLAYQRYAQGGYRIWISPLAGGTPVPLRLQDWYQDAPTWSPDGEWIAYVLGSSSGNGWSVVKVRFGAGRGAPVELKSGISVFARPQWSPDGRWIACQTPDGLTLIAPDGGATRVVSQNDWLTYAWSADSRRIVGLRPTDDLHHFLLASVDIATGRDTIVNPNLGTIPQANQPIRGFSRIRNEGFLTSIARVRSDIWLLEGFERPGTFVGRLWPFDRSR